MRHNAIVVTSWKREALDAAVQKARELGLEVLGPSAEVTNGIATFLVCPDGSKEGWEESDKGDEQRTAFRAWMNSQAYDDWSTLLEWVEFYYGSDDREAGIVASSWAVGNEGSEGRWLRR